MKIVLGSYTESKAFQGPYFVQMDVTHACNLKCLFCNTQHPKLWHHPIDYSTYMDFDFYKTILGDLGQIGLRALTFTGTGEPTLNKHFVEMVSFATRLGIKTSVNTNGLLDEEKVFAIIDAGIGKINISLNAATPETHAEICGLNSTKPFEKIMRAIEAINGCRRKRDKSKIPIRLSFVLTAINYHETIEMIELAKKLDADTVLFIIGAEMDRAEETKYLMISGEDKLERTYRLLRQAADLGWKYKIQTNAMELAKQGKERGFYREGKSDIYETLPCLVGWYFANITAAGLVLPCCQCSEPMGDLKKNSFKEIWFSKHYRNFRKSYKKNPLKPMPGVFACEGCTDCSFVHYNKRLFKASRPWKGLLR